MTEKIKIRPMADGDTAFVMSSWLKNYKYSGLAVSRMRDSEYFTSYQPIVEKLVTISDIYVASLREDTDVIIGYLAIQRLTESDIIHYIFVKEHWRKVGIARLLINAAAPKSTTYFTHWTDPMNSLSSKNPHFIYNPLKI